MTPFWTLLDRYPPCLVRMLARHKRGPLKTDKEIAVASKIDLGIVEGMSELLDWDSVRVTTLRRFLAGCGIDLTNSTRMKRLNEYLARNPKLLYLRNDPEWETRWKPLIQKWRKIRA